MTKTRLEAFSDGVIAIIITIMVLELKTPHSTDWQSLKPLLPVFLSYVLSFVFIGIYWGNHHHLLHTVEKVNGKMIWANLHLLFWLSLIPFATGWMGEHNFATVPVTVYAALLILCGVAYTILLSVIVRSQPQNTTLMVALKKQNRKGIISVLAYALAIGVAFISPVISGVLFVMVAIMWLMPDRNIEKTIEKSH